MHDVIFSLSLKAWLNHEIFTHFIALESWINRKVLILSVAIFKIFLVGGYLDWVNSWMASLVVHGQVAKAHETWEFTKDTVGFPINFILTFAIMHLHVFPLGLILCLHAFYLSPVFILSLTPLLAKATSSPLLITLFEFFGSLALLILLIQDSLLHLLLLPTLVFELLMLPVLLLLNELFLDPSLFFHMLHMLDIVI